MRTVLVAGFSARALAQAARSAGYGVLAVDLFGDLDLRAIALDSRCVNGDLDAGFDECRLVDALDDLARDHIPVGLVLGSGFENRPALIERLAARWPLFGNDAEVISRAKNPRILAQLCATHGIPHPEIRTDPPGEHSWLAKRAGSAGGLHVGRDLEPDLSNYWQRWVGGEAVSALVVAEGTRACLLGLTDQWTAPASDAPYRYGGAVRPANVEPQTGEALEEAAVAIVEALGLKGLNSVDFVVDEDALWLLEVNPRPGATLDVFRRPPDRIFRVHVEACAGTLVEPLGVFQGAEAAALVYAREPIPSMPALDWPAWTADRQRPFTPIAAGAPVCTVLASAGKAEEARRRAGERVREIQNRLERLS